VATGVREGAAEPGGLRRRHRARDACRL